MKEALIEKTCPCKGCTNRSIECHSHCTLYAEWKQHHLEIKEKLRERNSIDKFSNSVFDQMIIEQTYIEKRRR